MTEVKDLMEQFESFRFATTEARILSERDQDYDDHHQWTQEEVDTLESRNQAAVVINRIKVKVNLLTGIQKKTRTKPKALPRTPKHTDGADAATEALRYVVDNNDFEVISSVSFRHEMVWGYGGAIVEVDGENITINEILPDRYYYDPFSRKLDFSDKKYDGIVLWMDAVDVKNDFPDSVGDIDTLFSSSFSESGTETFDDKPIWIDRARKRLRVCQHFFLEKNVWKEAFFTENLFLVEPHDSPYKDEFGKPLNPIETQTAYIDRELNRYGEVRSYIWLQDEINHRRSRLLYAGSVSRTMGEDGAVDNITEMKGELAKADGHVRYNKGFDFQILPNDSISETQLLLYRESKQEIDEIGASFSKGISGETSGRARQIQQQGTIAELASLYDGHKQWEKRIYRQIWHRIRQFWKAEKWVRVTDDKSNLEWVGLNTPVTFGEQLQEAAQQGSEEAVEALQFGLQQQDPRLNEVVETKNNVAELDVDIILTEAPDFVTIRQEQFEILAALAERYGPENVPFNAMLELSDMPDKEAVKKLIQPDPALLLAQQQASQQQMNKGELENIGKQLQNQGQQIDNLQKQIETAKIANEPIDNLSINI